MMRTRTHRLPAPLLRAVQLGGLVALGLGTACDDVKVVAPPLEDIEVAPPSLQIRVGESDQLTASLIGPDGIVLQGRTVRWSSSASGIALVDATGTVAGISAGQAVVTASSEGLEASAVVTVLPEGAIQVSQSSVVFSAQSSGGGPDPVIVDVDPVGDQEVDGLSVAVTYASGEPAGWLTATLASTRAPTALTLSVVATGLPTGTYTALVDLSAPDAPSARVTVALVVSERPPEILLGRSTVSFSTPQGMNPASQAVAVLNRGDGTVEGLSTSVTYPSGQPGGWLAAALDGSTTPTSLTLSVTASTLAQGTYGATVRVSSTNAVNSPQDIAVSLTVAPPGPLIAVDPPEFVFEAVQGTALPAPDTFDVTNAGSDALTGLTTQVRYSAGEPSGWLDVTPSGSTAPTTVRVQANATNLPVGTWRAFIDVRSSVARNSPQVVSVTYSVIEPPALELDSTALVFDVVQGDPDPDPRQVRLSNAGGSSLDSLRVASIVYAADPSGWLVAGLDGPTAPAFLTVAPTVAGLAAGSHDAVITVVADDAGAQGSPAQVAVRVNVGPPPSADLAITVNDGVQTVVQGSPLTYTIVVSNGGPADVEGARVLDTIPAALEDVTWTCTAGSGAVCGSAAGSGDVDVDVDLAAGASVTLEATGTVTGTGTLTNRAHVIPPASPPDPDPSDNDAEDSDTRILLPVAVGVTLTDSTTTATQGTTHTWWIVVRNEGPADAAGVALTDTIPAAVQSVTWSCTLGGGESCGNGAGSVVSASLTIAAGDSAIITVQGLLAETGTVTHTARVALPDDLADSDASDHASTDSTDVVPPVVSQILTPPPAPERPGSSRRDAWHTGAPALGSPASGDDSHVT